MAKNKVKVPKKVGRVKTPKALRKSGVVEGFLNNPLGRDILAGALVAAAGAAVSALARHRPSASQVAEAGSATLATGGRAAKATADTVGDAVSTLSRAMTEVANSLVPAARDEPKGGKKRKKTRPAQAR